jgi:hypothetical protein
VNQELSAPKGFMVDEYERVFTYSDDQISSVWRRLQLRETFTQGQLFPYRVEFSANSQQGEFSPGELNIHHGPFLSVHGAIGEVTENYRSLNYFYGSYVFSFRLVRPVSLGFFRDGNNLKLRLKVYIRPWFRPVWLFCNMALWSSFKRLL